MNHSDPRGPAATVQAGELRPARMSALQGRRLSRPGGNSVVLWLTIPALALTTIFIIYPIFETVRLSFVQWPGIGPATFVGLRNFERLTTDSEFLTAIRNNLLFAVITTVGTVGLGTAFALAIDRKVRLWRIYRFVFFLPYILPMTVVAIMWSNALDPNYGWASGVLSFLNPAWSGGVLANSQTAIFVVCLVAIWQFAGFPMVLVLGGLRAIPQEMVEAARLDGANASQLARYISLPLVKDVLATVTLLQLIFSFKVFDIVQALTGGGPGSSTEVFGTLIYKDAFVTGNFGYASAIALVTSVAIIVISLVYLAILKPGRMERNG